MIAEANANSHKMVVDSRFNNQAVLIRDLRPQFGGIPTSALSLSFSLCSLSWSLPPLSPSSSFFQFSEFEEVSLHLSNDLDSGQTPFPEDSGTQ